MKLFVILLPAILGNALSQSLVVPVLKNRFPDYRESIATGSRTIQLTDFFGTAEILDEAARLTASYDLNGTEVIANFDFLLFRNLAPLTVANVLGYVDRGDYDDMFVHRVVRNFVIQGGGFRVTDDIQFLSIGTAPEIINEFNVSNTKGTLSMAKTAVSPDSATSQWFVSVVDNGDNLDLQNGGFTVFGRLSKSTFPNAEVLNNSSNFLLGNFGGAFTSVPLERETTPQTLNIDDFYRFDSSSRVPVEASDAGSDPALIYRIKSQVGNGSILGQLNGDQLELTYSSPQVGDEKTFVLEIEDSVGNLVEDVFTVTFIDGVNFTEWRLANYEGGDASNDAVSGPDADPDGDGMTNLQHFFHGVPLSDASGPVVQIDEDFERNQIFLEFPNEVAAAGIRWIAERSYDLLQWDSVPAPSNTVSGQTTLTIAQDESNFPYAFYRIKLTLD